MEKSLATVSTPNQGDSLESQPISVKVDEEKHADSTPCEAKVSESMGFEVEMIEATVTADRIAEEPVESSKTNHQSDQIDQDLFEPQLLNLLDFDGSSRCDPKQLGDKLLLRPLRRLDYHRGYLSLLENLTQVGTYSFDHFAEQFDRMKTADNTYFVVVVQDLDTDQVIGSATLLIERKFIHGCALRGRMEDVVVNEAYRKQRIGSLLIETVRLLARHLNVYKLSLDCKDTLIAYYERFGYQAQPGNANTLVIRF